MKWFGNIWKFLMVFCILLCQMAGCGQKDENAAAYGENLWEESTDSGIDVDFQEQETEKPSEIEGDWYVLDPAKKGEEKNKKITFKDTTCSFGETNNYGEGIFDDGSQELLGEYIHELQDVYSHIPYEYDGQNEILTIDYSVVFQKIEGILEEKIEESPEAEKGWIREFQEEWKKEIEQFDNGKITVYAPIYDDILFLYVKYSDGSNVNDFLEYENPNFPNSSCLFEKSGTYYAFSGAMSRKPEFPYVRSMSLDFGSETMEDCLCSYYANWVGAFSVGFLEDVYGIYGSDTITVSQELEAEFTPSMVDDDNLSLDKAEDVPAGDAVWEMYAGCPLEEVKYVTYSHDTDAGRQSSGIYMGKTYGLWSVLWTNGEL